MKTILYISGILLVSMIVYTGVAPSDYVFTHQASLIAYMLLGALPFAIKLKTFDLVVMQIVLFSISLSIGGRYSCFQYGCGLEMLTLFIPLTWAAFAVAVWVVTKIVLRLSRKGK